MGELSRRPRVLYLGHVARWSGGEIALARVLPALAAHVNPLVVLGEDGPLVAALRADGIRVEVLPLAAGARELRRDRVVRGGAVRAAAQTASYTVRLARLMRRERIDLVHTNTLKAALYGGVAARMARVPVLWHVRDRLAADYLSPRTARVVRGAARVLPSVVIANSAATAVTVPVRATVVHDATGLRTVARVPHEGVVIGMAGRLAPWKGQAEFLQAFALAFGEDPHVRAVIVGTALFGEDDYAQSLHRIADELGFGGRVEFRGFRADMAAEYSRLDLLVHYSISAEPFGQVVSEGMAAGLCVLAAGEGGPAEIVTDGVDGVLVRPRDPHALAASLQRWAHDADGRARLGHAARIAASARTPERVAEEIMAVYRTLSIG